MDIKTKKMPERIRKIISERKIIKAGRRDGRDWEWRFWPFIKKSKSPVPLIDDTKPSLFEQQLIDSAEGNFNKIFHDEYKEKDTEFFKQYCKAKKDIRSLKEKIDEINRDETRKEKIKELDIKITDTKTAKKDWEIYINSHKRTLLNIIFLLLMFSGEAVFNVQAFYLLGSGRFETWLMALAIIIGLPYAAHSIGSWLKEEKKSRIAKIIAFTVGIVVILLIIGIGWIREELLKETIKEMGFEISPMMSNFFFIITNLFLFVLLLMVEYRGAPSDQQKYKDSKTKLSHYKEELSSLEKEKQGLNEELSNLQERLSNAKEKIVEMKIERIDLFKQYQSEIKEERNAWQQLIGLYRNENLLIRHDRTMPKIFAEDPTIKIDEAGDLAKDLDKQKSDEEVEKFLNWACYDEESV